MSGQVCEWCGDDEGGYVRCSFCGATVCPYCIRVWECEDVCVDCYDHLNWEGGIHV